MADTQALAQLDPTGILHPFPCKYFPRFDTKHAAAELIREYQRRGVIKRCAHAVIKNVRGEYGSIVGYRVDCAEGSFDIRQSTDRYASPGDNEFFGCPANCRFYRNKRLAGIEKHLNQWYGYGAAATARTIGFFERLDTLKFVALVVLALALLGFLGREEILELFKELIRLWSPKK